MLHICFSKSLFLCPYGTSIHPPSNIVNVEMSLPLSWPQLAIPSPSPEKQKVTVCPHPPPHRLYEPYN